MEKKKKDLRDLRSRLVFSLFLSPYLTMMLSFDTQLLYPADDECSVIRNEMP